MRLLVDMFIRQISEQAGIRPRKIGDDAMAVLQTHDWPGNIRQASQQYRTLDDPGPLAYDPELATFYHRT